VIFFQFRETNDGIFELHLLKLCAKSNSIKIINWITDVIGHKLYRSKIDKKLLTKEALELLRLWSQNENFQSLNTGWMLEMIAKTDIEYSIKFLEMWINAGVSDILEQLFFPTIFRELFKNYKRKFVDTVNNWKGKKNFFKPILFCMKDSW